ncbi:hypothetical protein HHK36_011770 [Tetracentron sinense]|uniref:ribose-5-phosphate isomerase n=1 Tax=Tetracentron sinense TaxID=13715 RepID=A0A835DHL4_TETSI|nr:hypothetical protein HHK36_011770 [Tetracentron sinense]
MQGAISFNHITAGDKSLFYPKTSLTKSGSKFSGFKKRSLSLSISAVSQNGKSQKPLFCISVSSLGLFVRVIFCTLLLRMLGVVCMLLGNVVASTYSVGNFSLFTIFLMCESFFASSPFLQLKDVVAVGANYQSRVLARQFGVKTVDLNDVNNIDIAFDGVDEVDFNKNLLKGGGAAHTMQKVVDSVAKECIILADQSKVVHLLGSIFPVPVEVLPLAISPVLRRLVTLGGVPEIRSALRKDGPVITDLGNMVVDVSFPNGIPNPAQLENSINMIPGVVENGIVSGIATSVLVAIQDGDNVMVMDLEDYVKIVDGRTDASSTS